MDPFEFLLWLFGIVLIGVPLVMFGIPCIIAAIAMWRCMK